jgi:hypothetical protein
MLCVWEGYAWLEHVFCNLQQLSTPHYTAGFFYQYLIVTACREKMLRSCVRLLSALQEVGLKTLTPQDLRM